MLFYDTLANILRVRNESDSAWIDVGFVDQSLGKFSLFDDTKVVNSAGTQTGLLGDQTTATWVSGTSTTESLISPAKLKAASGGYTLVGSVATTSGTSVSISGVNLTSFEYLSVDFNEVVANNYSTNVFFGAVDASALVARLSPNGSNGTIQTSLNVGGIIGEGLNALTPQRPSTFRKNTTTLTFSLEDGSFTSGSITVFGIE